MIGSKLSRRYAKALLSLGQEDGQYEVYERNLQEFSLFCSANREFFQVISSQIFTVDERKKILNFVLDKGSFSDTLKNFLRLLLDKNRIGALTEITDYYSRLSDDISKITRAEVTTAWALKDEHLNGLEKALTQLTSRKVIMEVKEDTSLIGGLVVKIGDLILDGSVKAQLKGLKESLKRGEYS